MSVVDADILLGAPGALGTVAALMPAEGAESTPSPITLTATT
jgi:hypothetical protein